jgi:Na+-transporting NADH:ubiquinone oxidoreductase subunit C
MTTVVALVLSGMYTGLKDVHSRNEALFTKRAILTAVSRYLDKPVGEMTDEEVMQIFEQQMEQRVITTDGTELNEEDVAAKGYKGGRAEDVNMGKERKKPEGDRIYPLFIFEHEGEKYYIVTVRGSGLWDEIWGNVAIKDDFNTIAGASFDHQGETPGLGAEIKDNPDFSKQFRDKELYTESGEYVSITVRKGGAKDPDHEVDGITGATVTTDGVNKMLYDGIRKYESYFEKLKSGKGSDRMGILLQ